MICYRSIPVAAAGWFAPLNPPDRLGISTLGSKLQKAEVPYSDLHGSVATTFLGLGGFCLRTPARVQYSPEHNSSYKTWGHLVPYLSYTALAGRGSHQLHPSCAFSLVINLLDTADSWQHGVPPFLFTATLLLQSSFFHSSHRFIGYCERCYSLLRQRRLSFSWFHAESPPYHNPMRQLDWRCPLRGDLLLFVQRKNGVSGRSLIGKG